MKPKLLYLVTEDWYFCSHRLPIARAARDAGFEVLVATRVDRHADVICGEGFELLPVTLRRREIRPWREHGYTEDNRAAVCLVRSGALKISNVSCDVDEQVMGISDAG